MRLFSTILLTGILLLGVTTSCGDDDDDTADALSSVCDQQEQVVSDLEALAALDPATNTASDYQSAVDDLEGDVDDLVSARGDLAEQDVDNVQATYDSLQSELEGLDDVPLAEAREDAGAAIVQAIAELRQQYDTAYANSSCAE